MDLRKELIDFGKTIQKNYGIFLSTEHLEQEIDSYLSINCDLDETQTVRQNEQQEKDFFCGKSIFTGKRCDSKNDCNLPDCRTFKKKDS